MSVIEYDPADDLPPLRELLLGFVPVPEDDGEDDDEASLLLESLAVDLPLELSLRRAAGAPLELLGSTPTQRIETTILPVWHRLRLTIVTDHGE